MNHDEARAQFLEAVIGGAGIRAYAERPGTPSRQTITAWLARDPEFRRSYIEARTVHVLEDLTELQATVTDMSLPVGERRIRMDTTKWALCKVLPKLAKAQTGAG